MLLQKDIDKSLSEMDKGDRSINLRFCETSLSRTFLGVRFWCLWRNDAKQKNRVQEASAARGPRGAGIRCRRSLINRDNRMSLPQQNRRKCHGPSAGEGLLILGGAIFT